MNNPVFVKPNVIISRCLEFAACRYDGQVISDSFIRKLKKHVTFTTVCPEVDIGMGIPRDPIRIVKKDDNDILLQPSTGQEFGDKMTRYAKKTLKKFDEIDGFILKSRSPSCGIKDVKLFSENPKSPSLGKTSGFYAREVLEQFGHLAVEDEGRLTNYRIREHFLTKLYTLATFRTIKVKSSIKTLTAFHARNKYLFMAYNQTAMRQMGKIAANHEKHAIENVIVNYEMELHRLLANLPRFTSHINTLEHIFGYFKNEIKTSEKQYFISLLTQYREEVIPLSALLILLRGWVIRYEQTYLADQTYFLPYPEALIEITDSGKGRDS